MNGINGCILLTSLALSFISPSQLMPLFLLTNAILFFFTNSLKSVLLISKLFPYPPISIDIKGLPPLSFSMIPSGENPPKLIRISAPLSTDATLNEPFRPSSIWCTTSECTLESLINSSLLNFAYDFILWVNSSESIAILLL